MIRRFAAASLLALASLSLAGCAVPNGGPYATSGSSSPYGSVYSPYDGSEPSACGALGNCPVTQPLRLNNTDLHGGGG